MSKEFEKGFRMGYEKGYADCRGKVVSALDEIDILYLTEGDFILDCIDGTHENNEQEEGGEL